MSLLYFTFQLLDSKKENCYVDVIHVAILEQEHPSSTIHILYFVVGVEHVIDSRLLFYNHKIRYGIPKTWQGR